MPGRREPLDRPCHPQLLRDIPISETYPDEPAPPPLSDIFSPDPERRHPARLYWIHHSWQGLANTGFHYALVRLPIGLVSSLGQYLGDLSRHRYRRRIFAKRIRGNMSQLRQRARDTNSQPSSEPSEDAPALRRWWQNTARTLAEFAVLNRLACSDRITVRGQENLEAAQATGRPLVFVSVHLATWEAVIAATHLGPAGPSIGPFQPEPNRFSNRIVFSQRKARGQYLFPPGLKSAFHLRRLFGAGAASLIIFIDEVRDHQVHFPHFGRPAPEAGNSVVAIKLANSAGGLIVPVHIRRTHGAHFDLTYHPAVAPNEADGDAYDLTTTQDRLNAVFEPLILDHLDQWYMLAEVRL